MKINESRKSTHSVMNNSGFGGVLFKDGNSEIFIPQQFIFKNGKLKKYAKKLIADAQLNVEHRKVV